MWLYIYTHIYIFWYDILRYMISYIYVVLYIYIYISFDMVYDSLYVCGYIYIYIYIHTHISFAMTYDTYAWFYIYIFCYDMALLIHITFYICIYTLGSRFATVRFTTIHLYDPCPVGPSTPHLWPITVATQASFLYSVRF
jgi:hypothetical protein